MQGTAPTSPIDTNRRNRAPQPPGSAFSMKPALVVGGVAVLILVAFSIGAALTHTATSPAKPAAGSTVVKGSSLRAMSAQAGLAVIEQAGQPPANVVAAITLPVGAVRVSTTNPGAGSAGFDREVRFSVDASQEAVLGFYRTELHDLGWRTVTTGPASHQAGEQMVGQIAGNDGYYWQLGVIVSPSTFTASGTGDVTRFTLRVLQVADN